MKKKQTVFALVLVAAIVASIAIHTSAESKKDSEAVIEYEIDVPKGEEISCCSG